MGTGSFPMELEFPAMVTSTEPEVRWWYVWTADRVERMESTAVRYLIQWMLPRLYTLECTQQAGVSDIVCTLLFCSTLLQCLHVLQKSGSHIAPLHIIVNQLDYFCFTNWLEDVNYQTWIFEQNLPKNTSVVFFYPLNGLRAESSSFSILMRVIYDGGISSEIMLMRLLSICSSPSHCWPLTIFTVEYSVFAESCAIHQCLFLLFAFKMVNGVSCRVSHLMYSWLVPLPRHTCTLRLHFLTPYQIVNLFSEIPV